MANETELSNMIYATDIVANELTPAFVQRDNILGIVKTFPTPDNTNVVKVAKAGSLTAAAGTESTAYSFGAGSELTDTATTLTATRHEVASKITIEALRFGSPFNELSRTLREQGEALNRLLASDFKSLFSSVSGSVTAASILTKDDLLDAKYNVVSSTLGAGSRMLVAMVDHKGSNELQKELSDSGASVFNSTIDLGGLMGVADAGAPKGEIFGIAVYETSGLPTDSGDDIGLVWDPELAFTASIDPNGVTAQVKNPESQEPWLEVFSYMFWSIGEHADSAACQLKSDT